MREASREIARLCEQWWARLADATKAEQHGFAGQILDLLGWSHVEPVQLTVPGAEAARVSYILRGGAETAVAAHFVMPGALEPPSSLVERGLDFCVTTRRLANATRALNVAYAWVTDLNRSYFYDVGADELLLHADGPADFNRSFVRVLSRGDVERGAVEEIRRQPRSYAARQLREWESHWCAQLCAEDPRLDEEKALLALDRLVVVRFLAEHPVLKRAQWDLRRRFDDLTALALADDPAGCGAGLVELFRVLVTDWHAGLFAAAPPLEEALARDTVAGPLLRELALLSRTKFTIATVLESFNFGEPAEKARVRMVPDANKEQEAYLARQTLATIDAARLDLDVAEEGYRAVFHWFDKLVAVYERLDVEFDAQGALEPAPEDLLAWAERDGARPEALVDKRRYAAERGLTLHCATARQRRTACLMLYLHVIGRYHQGHERMGRFPDLAESLQHRAARPSARSWGTAPAADAAEESEVV